MPPESKRGRPPIAPGETPTKVQVYVSASDYDRAFDVARRQGISVPQVLRTGLRRVLDDPDDE